MGSKLIVKPKFMTIKEVRKRLKMSQTTFAEKLSVTRGAVSRWERGEFEMNLNLSQIKVLNRLLQQIGLSFEDLPDTSANRHKNPLIYK